MAEVKSIDETWETQGNLLYRYVFDAAPYLKALFAMEDLEGEKYKNAMQSFRPTQTFRKIEKTLQNPSCPENDAFMFKLGVFHRKMKIKTEFFKIMEDSLVKALADLLKAKWNEELERAWRGAYGFVLGKMLQGYYS